MNAATTMKPNKGPLSAKELALAKGIRDQVLRDMEERDAALEERLSETIAEVRREFSAKFDELSARLDACSAEIVRRSDVIHQRIASSLDQIQGLLRALPTPTVTVENKVEAPTIPAPVVNNHIPPPRLTEKEVIYQDGKPWKTIEREIDEATACEVPR